MITQDDYKKQRQLLGIIAEADFKIKGDAILAVASLLTWYQDLGERMRKHLTPIETKPKKKGAK